LLLPLVTAAAAAATVAPLPAAVLALMTQRCRRAAVKLAAADALLQSPPLPRYPHRRAIADTLLP
jgi:hypothetical protein